MCGFRPSFNGTIEDQSEYLMEFSGRVLDRIDCESRQGDGMEFVSPRWSDEIYMPDLAPGVLLSDLIGPDLFDLGKP
jgi:hypothetical protein